MSVSTVERVERGEKVSEESLDKIALALGYETGAFHTPRIPLGPEKAFESLVETYGHLEEVPVSPLKRSQHSNATEHYNSVALRHHAHHLVPESGEPTNELCRTLQSSSRGGVEGGLWSSSLG